jgi:hypothetical protein
MSVKADRWHHSKSKRWRFTVERDDERDHLEIWAQGPDEGSSSIPAILEQKFFSFDEAVRLAKRLARISQCSRLDRN